MYPQKRITHKKSKGRVEQSRLEAQLKLLEKEKKNVLRMHDSEAQRFRARHSNWNIDSDSFSEAAGVKMYQTHNPGFCYKRNGDYKTPLRISPKPSIDFPQLKKLLFTDGELDVEKLLCLHMLSIHRTESLKLPTIKKLSEMSKEDNAPIERLIQRSKKMSKEKTTQFDILKILPKYVIDIGQCISATTISTSKDGIEEPIFNDARLTSRLIVNEKVEKILVSALMALKKSKSKKLLQITENCQNSVYLKKIFNKLTMQDFLKMLRTYSLLTSCESYYLTPKIKQQPIHLEVRTIFGHLEALVFQIRRHILRFPSRTKNEWKAAYECDLNIADEDIMSITSQQWIKYDLSKASQLTKQRKQSKSIISSISTSKGTFDYLDKGTTSFQRKLFKSFISRNMQGTKCHSISTRLDEDLDEDNTSISTKDSWVVTRMLKNYCPVNSKLCVLSTVDAKPESEKKQSQEIVEIDDREQTEEEFIKNTEYQNTSFIKRSNCCACQEKWKRPLPTPKTPTYRTPRLTEENPLRTNRMNQLSSIIHDELYKLSSYSDRYSLHNANTKIKLPSNRTVPIVPDNDVSILEDSVEISPYNLERISHEIANSEIDKKLNEFLKEII